jgi:transcription factor SPT20
MTLLTKHDTLPGCMIVEIEDFRPPNTKDDKASKKSTVARALLHPNSETLFADLCLLNQKDGNKWTDKDALVVKAKILVRSFSSFA